MIRIHVLSDTVRLRRLALPALVIMFGLLVASCGGGGGGGAPASTPVASGGGGVAVTPTPVVPTPSTPSPGGTGTSSSVVLNVKNSSSQTLQLDALCGDTGDRRITNIAGGSVGQQVCNAASVFVYKVTNGSGSTVSDGCTGGTTTVDIGADLRVSRREDILVPTTFVVTNNSTSSVKLDALCGDAGDRRINTLAAGSSRTERCESHSVISYQATRGSVIISDGCVGGSTSLEIRDNGVTRK